MDELYWGVLLLEKHLHQLVAEHGSGIEQELPVLLCLSHPVSGDFRFLDLFAGLPLEAVGLHRNEVDAPLVLLLQAQGQLQEHRIVTQLLAKLVAYPVGIGSLSIALVDEGDPRNAVALHLPIDGERL